MYPHLFEIPFLHLTIGTFGPMIVLGFLAALFMMRQLIRRAGLDPAMMTNAALYSLIIGVVGARAFFVIHHFDQFHGNLIGVVATWRGGLEFLGGVIPATGFLLFYLCHHKLPVRRYLDIMAIGLMMGLAFGRIGCFLNGDCFGKPTDLPWGVRFPYGSFVYTSQINPDPKRHRSESYLELPQAEYLSFYDEHGKWYPKPMELLTEQQQHEVTQGRYRCLAVHPSQLYASANALLLCGILYVFWRKSLRRIRSDNASRRLGQPGSMVGLMFVLYGFSRFLLECIRDDNPYEFGILTISQILGIVMLILGVVLLVLFPYMKRRHIFLMVYLFLIATSAVMAQQTTSLGDVKKNDPSSSGYKLVWADEFDKDGRPDPCNWNYERGFVRNEELQWYQPENARCENGLLIIEGRRERKQNPRHKSNSRNWRGKRKYSEYTSASLTTKDLHNWMYGRFEMRGRIDTRAGLWPAFWTLGIEGQWPSCGEIDIMEYYRGVLLANAAWGTEKRWVPMWDDIRIPTTEFNDPNWSTKFHVWRMDWDVDSIKLYVDNVLLNTIDLKKTFNRNKQGRNPFRQPHYIILNLAIGGSSGGDPSNTNFPAKFEVDYVRIYKQQLLNEAAKPNTLVDTG